MKASEKTKTSRQGDDRTYQVKSTGPESTAKPERIAKRIARAGLCSRRDAERWINDGRVELNGQRLTTPAITVTMGDKIVVDGQPLPDIEKTRLWLFHKKSGYVTTNRDPEGRKTVFDVLPKNIPRVLSIGRLDMATEGLLLLTNDGGLARVLELPATGWLRRYRVRAHGRVTQQQLDGLAKGVAVDGVLYGAITATLDRQQGHNCWLTLSFREGKNREVKKVLASLGLDVNRLIRLSYGPFQLADLEPGDLREIRGRTLREQLGERLILEAGANFDAPLIDRTAAERDVPSTGSSKGKSRGKKIAKTREQTLSRLQTTNPRRQGKTNENRKPKKPARKKPTRHLKEMHADRRR